MLFTAFTAFLDASVLYPASVRNLLMRLALAGLFRAKWSDEVHEEWIRALLRDRPDLSPQKLARTRGLMDAHAPDALVTGYEALTEEITLPDPNDRHVVAASVFAGADVIVTRNLRHFPASALAPFNIEALHPDEFLVQLHASSASAFLNAAWEHRQSLRNPQKTAAEYIDTLEKQGLVQTAAFLREYAALL